MKKREFIDELMTKLTPFGQDYLITNVTEDTIHLLSKNQRLLVSVEVSKYMFNIFRVKFYFFATNTFGIVYSNILARKTKNNFKLLRTWTS